MTLITILYNYVLAVSNKRHCHYLCTTESTCKSMKFDETSGICSLYDDEAPIIMPGSSDTVAAFSLPKVSCKWRM